MRNPFEERVGQTLGPEYAYEPIKLSYTIQARYIPDFVDVANKRIVEAKGLWDAADRRKIKLIREQHPEWRIHMVFTNPYKTISKASKTRYCDICDKLGVTWEEGPKAPRKLTRKSAGKQNKTKGTN